MLGELLATEENYVEDLHSVLCGYRDRLDTEAGDAEDEELKQKADDIFGNMEDIFEFHSGSLLPDLGRCGGDVRRVGKTFLEYSEDIRKIYCRCTTMSTKIWDFHNIQRRPILWLLLYYRVYVFLQNRHLNSETQ